MTSMTSIDKLSALGNFQKFVEAYIDYPVDYALVNSIRDNKCTVDYFYDDDTILAFLCWYVLNSTNQTIAVVVPRYNPDINHRLCQIIDRVADDFQYHFVKEWNQSSIKLKNGCYIKIGNHPNYFRGTSIGLIFLYRAFECDTDNLDAIVSCLLPAMRVQTRKVIVQVDMLRENGHVQLLKSYGIE